MNFDVVIPLYNGGAFIDACLRALERQTLPARQIFVVDDQSTDGSGEQVRTRHTAVHVLTQPRNAGFSHACNAGLARTRDADVTLVLNQDTVAAPDCLAQLAAAQRETGAGVLGCKLLYPGSQTIQHAGGYIDWTTGNAYHFGQDKPDASEWNTARDVPFVTGAALALSRAALAAIDGFDAALSPAYFEDVDLCFRARAAGFGVRYAPSALLTHHEGSVLTKQSYRQFWGFYCGRLGFVLKHGTREQIDGVLANDQAFRDHAAMTEDNLARGRACLYQAARIDALRARRVSAYPNDTLANNDAYWRAVAAGLLGTTDAAFERMSRAVLADTSAEIPVKAPMLRDYATASALPVIGPVLTLLRSLFLSLTGQRARRQTQFNAQVLAAIEQLDRRSELLARQQQELLRAQLDLTAQRTQPHDGKQ